MGILNLTPDSFFSGSRVADEKQLISRAAEMISEGAEILDIGGQSTRPGSEFLSAAEEWERLAPVLEKICTAFPETIISIDTFHHEVAMRAVSAGAGMVNDISGGQLDPAMLVTVGALNVPYVCMHSRGTPQTMTGLTSYNDLVPDVTDYFIERIAACRAAGIKDIILDPGFGFAKTTKQNFDLLRQMDSFQILGFPLLLGISRKGMIWKTLNSSPDQALNGTTVLNTIGLCKGASLLRVHDVAPAREAIQLWETLNGNAY
ncbi:dihydropteroate synthase [Flavihumibacter petaseus]|nr:dihydropteroate synthase [Flavihumibacter petaseus]